LAQDTVGAHIAYCYSSSVVLGLSVPGDPLFLKMLAWGI